MEHEPTTPTHAVKDKQAEQEPRLPTPEHKDLREDVHKKVEMASDRESGHPTCEKPGYGLELLVWKFAERIVSSAIRRERLNKEVLEKIKDAERLKIILVSIESHIRRLAKAVYIPLFRAMLRNYRDSFDALAHGNSSERTSPQSPEEH